MAKFPEPPIAEKLLPVLLSKERRAAAAVNQAELREVHAQRIRKNPTPSESNYIIGERQLAMAQSALNHLSSDLAARGRVYEQMAEAYAHMGQFDKAANQSFDPKRQARYMEFAAALKRRPTAGCSCPDSRIERDPLNSKGKRIPQRTVLSTVWNPELGEVTFWRCDVCQSITAV